jgi:hypothetical protein
LVQNTASHLPSGPCHTSAARAGSPDDLRLIRVDAVDSAE